MGNDRGRKEVGRGIWKWIDDSIESEVIGAPNCPKCGTALHLMTQKVEDY